MEFTGFERNRPNFTRLGLFHNITGPLTYQSRALHMLCTYINSHLEEMNYNFQLEWTHECFPQTQEPQTPNLLFLDLVTEHAQVVSSFTAATFCRPSLFRSDSSCLSYASLITLKAWTLANGVWVIGSKYFAGSLVTGQYFLIGGFFFLYGKLSR